MQTKYPVVNGIELKPLCKFNSDNEKEEMFTYKYSEDKANVIITRSVFRHEAIYSLIPNNVVERRNIIEHMTGPFNFYQEDRATNTIKLVEAPVERRAVDHVDILTKDQRRIRSAIENKREGSKATASRCAHCQSSAHYSFQCPLKATTKAVVESDSYRPPHFVSGESNMLYTARITPIPPSFSDPSSGSNPEKTTIYRMVEAARDRVSQEYEKYHTKSIESERKRDAKRLELDVAKEQTKKKREEYRVERNKERKSIIEKEIQRCTQREESLQAEFNRLSEEAEQNLVNEERFHKKNADLNITRITIIDPATQQDQSKEKKRYRKGENRPKFMLINFSGETGPETFSELYNGTRIEVDKMLLSVEVLPARAKKEYQPNAAHRN